MHALLQEKREVKWKTVVTTWVWAPDGLGLPALPEPVSHMRKETMILTVVIKSRGRDDIACISPAINLGSVSSFTKWDQWQNLPCRVMVRIGLDNACEKVQSDVFLLRGVEVMGWGSTRDMSWELFFIPLFLSLVG